jgi:hypothetical protein
MNYLNHLKTLFYSVYFIQLGSLNGLSIIYELFILINLNDLINSCMKILNIFFFLFLKI